MSAPKMTRQVPSVRMGDSGLHISKLVLGTMSYGSKKWQDWVLEEEEAMEHFKAAYDCGIYTWDTANVYSNGESEVLVGKAIKKFNIPREELVILTKLNGLVTTDSDQGKKNGNPNQQGLSRKHIFASVKDSLKRLDLQYVDVLQCHRFDYKTPIGETMQALHDVVQAGLVRYIGMSSCHTWQFAEMQTWARLHGTTQFLCTQPQFSAIYREEERELLPLCKYLGIGVISWSALARGYLSRPASDQKTARTATDANWARNTGLGEEQDAPMLTAINAAVESVAKTRGITMAQAALAWTLAQPGITAPIIGSTKLDSIYELVDALDIQLTPEEIQQISSPYRPRKVFGFQ